ncbi:DUF3599 family protein [Heyndrickxia sporothermodurans]
MSYRNLLTHRCDIHHLKERNSSSGSFGIPIQDIEKEYYYEEFPDITDVPCYFTEKNQTIVQGEPNQHFIQAMLIHFFPSADVRLNDKVIWDGISYKLQKPRKIKNHHIEVIGVRDDK